MVVDLCLPDDVTLDVIINANRRKTPIKVIASSAVCDQLYLDIATDIGADAAIRKNLDGEASTQWLELIHRLLGEPASDRAPTQRLVVLADDDEELRAWFKSVLQ